MYENGNGLHDHFLIHINAWNQHHFLSTVTYFLVSLWKYYSHMFTCSEYTIFHYFVGEIKMTLVTF